VIRSRVSVNQWLQRVPSVDEVRPGTCVVCDAAARPGGGRLVLHGHGLRSRQLRGPPAVRAPPSLREVLTRRYECQRCGAVLVVVPCDVAPRRHYAATAIALALALYGVLGRSQATVRSAVSSDGALGVCATYRWRTLARWIDAMAAHALLPALHALAAAQGRRAIAQRAAMAIGAHAPPSLPEGAPELRAFAGAALMA
jgi:hypothetical protein